jgi:hypothetical protein
MILVFPILVIVAIAIALRRADRGSAATHPRWFVAWSLAGAALTFSFLTGLSIGLLVLPFAAAILWWVARTAPLMPDSLGFVAGIGVVLLLVAFLNRGGEGVDPLPWLFAGLFLDVLAIATYVLLSRRMPRRSIG